MRTIWPLLAAAMLAVGVAGTGHAQFALNSLGGKRSGTASAPAGFGPVGMPQMMPKSNLAQTMGGNPLGKSRTFSFANMLPNFSSLKTTMGPPRPTYSQFPASSFAPGYRKK